MNILKLLLRIVALVFKVLFAIIYGILRLIYIPLWFIGIVSFYFILKFVTYLLGKMRIGNTICLNGQLFTPVVQLYNKFTNRKVILVGMIHVGDKTYYQTLQAIINSRESYKVLFEGVSHVTKEQEALFTQDEKTRYQELMETMNMLKVLGEILKLEGQRDHLDYSDKWIRTDMTLFDFVRKLSSENIDMFKMSDKFKSFHKSNFKLRSKEGSFQNISISWLTNKQLMVMSAFSYFYNFFGLFSAKKRRGMKLVLDERNHIGVEGILRESKDSNIISLWGSAHLPGMIKELKKCGYVITSKQWIPAYTSKKETIFDLIIVGREQSKRVSRIKKELHTRKVKRLMQSLEIYLHYQITRNCNNN